MKYGIASASLVALFTLVTFGIPYEFPCACINNGATVKVDAHNAVANLLNERNEEKVPPLSEIEGELASVEFDGRRIEFFEHPNEDIATEGIYYSVVEDGTNFSLDIYLNATQRFTGRTKLRKLEW